MPCYMCHIWELMHPILFCFYVAILLSIPRLGSDLKLEDICIMVKQQYIHYSCGFTFIEILIQCMLCVSFLTM